LVLPRMTQLVLDTVIAKKEIATLVLLVLLLLLVSVVQQLLALWRRLQLVHWSLKFDRVTLCDFVGQILSAPLLWHREHRSGDLVSRLSDHEHIRHFFLGVLPRVCVDSCMVVIYAAVLLTYNLTLCAIVFFCLVLIALQTWYTGKTLRQAHVA